MTTRMALTAVLIAMAWHPAIAGDPPLLLPAMRHCDLTLQGPDRMVFMPGVPLAVSPPDQRRGLSRLKPGGQPLRMLFVWNKPVPQAVWMHDTPAPLDAAFLDANGRIFQVISMSPNTDAHHYPKVWPSAMLEDDAGDLIHHGIGEGWVLVRHRCYGGGQPEHTAGPLE
ncbi:DUF192 domain-containing protein [Dyella sp. M7H15-1]|uniref:DUF192 domain-containing protein n=1 Tax=Dyella sp. M7H15-1 TaxID=2501295 RepID=UPI0013E8EEF7|nr:DUF192 domain-containing protein [Dyella sp. M7H15-1]